MRTFFFCLWALTATCLVQATEIPENVKANIRERISKDVTPSVIVAMIDAEGVTWFKHGNIAKGGPEANENHVYEIGSVTKTFTSLLLADMVRKGEVSLDDPIDKYLPPGVKARTFNGKHITLANLATHRSSLPRMPSNFKPANPADPYADYEQKMLYEFINSCELTHEIGSQNEYSNLGMALLGNLLAHVAGMDYNTLLRTRVLEPLGMTGASLTVNDSNRSMIATGHNDGDPVSNWELNCMSPAGALKVSAEEMVRYVSAQMGLQKSELFDAMKETQMEVPGAGMGLAWMITDGKIVGHGGATGGYQSYVGFLSDHSKGVVVLSNSSMNVGELGMAALDPSKTLRPVTRSLSASLKKVLEKDGAEAMVRHYLDLKTNFASEYRFREAELNNLGYWLMGEDRLEDALMVLQLNATEYPEAGNPADSLAEIHTKLAVKSYKRALELDPTNPRAIEFLDKMGEAKPEAPTLTAEQLNNYLGRYELAEGRIFAVTHENGQLFIQLTGQSPAPIFYRADDTFFAKVVNAQFIFHRDEADKVISLTFRQGKDRLCLRIGD